MNPWWLLLIVPFAVSAGLLLMLAISYRKGGW